MSNIQTVTYQCPNCNAALEYDNAGGKFRCFYCDSTFTENDIKNIFKGNESISLEENEPELDESQKETEEFTGQSALYTCPNCGAGVICDSLTASTRCHFCHTPVILSGRLSGEFKPDFIIPFATTQDEARENFRKYTRGKFLLPNGFRSEAQINNISALYVPYWLKSGTADVHFTGTGKTIRTWTSGNTRYTHTKVYEVVRDAELEFVRVPYDGSKRINDDLMQSIEPFNYRDLKPFSMSFLSGCAAEKYDVEKQEAARFIDGRIQKASEEEVKRMASVYNVIENASTAVRYRNIDYAYALLPVWFLNYTYKGKDYEFAMNGQTGTMFGELPISGIKRFLYTLGVGLLTAAIAFLIGGLFFD